MSQIKIVFQEDGRKQERHFDFNLDANCRQAVEHICSKLSIAEDWTFAIYSKKHGGWIHDDTRISDIIFKGGKSLELRAKTPSYFSALPSTNIDPSKSSLRDSARLRGTSSPIDHHRLFNFFRSSDDQFVSKFQNGCIYLSIIILNSDNKIMLSPTGLPPTVLISTVGGLANYYNFDSDSSDFAWMFKTTLDWASDPPPNRFRDPRSATASPEPRIGAFAGSTPDATVSPPSSRGSFSRSKRGSVSSTTGPSNGSNTLSASVATNFGARTAASSISVDASVTSDSTRYQSVYEYIDRKRDYRGENSLRQEYIAAVEELQHKLGSPPIDLLYDRVVDLPLVGAKSVMAIQYAREDTRDYIAPELLQMGSFRWRHIDSVSNSIYTRKEELWSQLTTYYDNVRVSRPLPGLYIGLYYTESTMAGLQILVPRQRRTFIPIVKLRDEARMTPEEWDWIKSTTAMDTSELAKNCAVTKDDPMHHLKVGFARSTSKLSQLTQLKWNPSDIYTLDTLQVTMQSTGRSPSRASQDSHVSTSCSDQTRLGPASLPQSMVAMDQDPIWQDRIVDDASRSFRVILFIKPTRHPTQPQEHYNKALFELCPFPIFDALHHSIFNNATYHQLRKTMLQLTNEIVDLEIEIEQETEDELALLKEKGLDYDAHEPEDDLEDISSSMLINDLGIKGESSPNVLYRHPLLQPSFTDDDTIHAASISKRSSTNSFMDVIKRSVLSAPSVVSLASSLSSLGSDPITATVESQLPPTGLMERARSRASMIEFDVDRSAFTSSNKRRGSRASQDSLQFEDHNNDETLSFVDMIQDLDPIAGKALLAASLNNISSVSLQSTNSISSVSSDDSYRRDGGFVKGKQRRLSLGHPRAQDGPLPPLPPVPRHRRSYSLVQAGDFRMSPAPVPGMSTTRSRTNSHSSYSHHPHISHYYHHYQHQQPVYKNRYLSSKNYPHYLSHIQQHQHHLRRHLNTNTNDKEPLLDNQELDSDNPYPPELRRLELQQQELQEKWRLVSWTRQLNEWDHARTLKSQGDILGVGMSLGMGLNLGINVNAGTGSTADLGQCGIPSPPRSTSVSSLHSDSA
ncbi:hypothetical protein BGZ98_005651 [Dissophora globulifera]|nr:hypothetical protein BGZ98_005651 [Dissophora globulifera]